MCVWERRVCLCACVSLHSHLRKYSVISRAVFHVAGTGSHLAAGKSRKVLLRDVDSRPPLHYSQSVTACLSCSSCPLHSSGRAQSKPGLLVWLTAIVLNHDEYDWCGMNVDLWAETMSVMDSETRGDQLKTGDMIWRELKYAAISVWHILYSASAMEEDAAQFIIDLDFSQFSSTQTIPVLNGSEKPGKKWMKRQSAPVVAPSGFWTSLPRRKSQFKPILFHFWAHLHNLCPLCPSEMAEMDSSTAAPMSLTTWLLWENKIEGLVQMALSIISKYLVETPSKNPCNEYLKVKVTREEQSKATKSGCQKDWIWLQHEKKAHPALRNRTDNTERETGKKLLFLCYSTSEWFNRSSQQVQINTLLKCFYVPR